MEMALELRGTVPCEIDDKIRGHLSFPVHKVRQNAGQDCPGHAGARDGG
jgi:hypothetical protein